MSEPRLISPMLDNFLMGDPVSDHHGVRCCPAMHKDTGDKYIVKVISIPSSKSRLDALLLTGAYASEEDALSYFEELAHDVSQENELLTKLSQLDGFLPYEQFQIVPMEDEIGFDIYLLSPYKRSLEKYFKRVPMTHLSALNLGIDLCAALSVCRRFGYIYVALKPSNVFVTNENTYRIGDLGFMRLDTLKYASLPDKYQGPYTPPEITDAFSALNETIDVYATGLILYQAYNDGQLPSLENDGTAFPAPAYADYEMAEIILKACALNPEDRWQSPLEMGQALVSYMQRNGANDTPIVPAMAEAEKAAEETQNAEPADISEEEETGLYEQTEDTQEVTEEPEEEEIAPAPEDIPVESIYTEDSHGNLTFLEEASDDETAPENELETVEYDEVSDEVSEIMAYADELISHETPAPVVEPEKIDVPIPAPLTEEKAEDENDTEAEEENSDEAAEEAAEESDDEAETVSEEETEDEEDEDSEKLPVKMGKIIRNVCIAVAVFLILAAGFFYYKNIYTQEVFIQLTGSEGTLTVDVDSKLSDDKLTVVCTDTYGNQLTKPVKNGKAVFTDLVPNAAYTVEIQADGFHRLTGKPSTAYSTPTQTSVLQFTAGCGVEDGSVVLSFTIDGTDSEQWKITYSSEGEEEKEAVFTGHSTTLNGFTVGKEYTFTLNPVDDLYFTGENVIKFTPTEVILAENLRITAFGKGSLTLHWSTPENVGETTWSVRCYDDAGFDKTLSVSDTKVTFNDIDNQNGYTIKVTAEGMQAGETLYISKNAIQLSHFKAVVTAPETLTLSWDSDKEVTAGGWVLLYTVDDGDTQEINGFTANTTQIKGIKSGSKYAFTLQTADSATVFNNELTYTVPERETLDAFGITADGLMFQMCKTPDVANWNRFNLAFSDFTDSFTSDQRASFLVVLLKMRGNSDSSVTTTFVIKDSKGKLVSMDATEAVWDDMWDNGYCELDIPALPNKAGEYTVDVYFNNQLAHSNAFTVK